MKHLTITLLTLFMSMGVHAVYVPGSDDGGWIILLVFLGYFIFIAVGALFSNAKETIEEKKNSKRKNLTNKKLELINTERKWPKGFGLKNATLNAHL